MSRQTISSPEPTESPRPPRNWWLYAVPSGRMPDEVVCRGRRYRHVKTFKHDFFAATGQYVGPDGDIAVLKIGRGHGLGLVPIRWVGAWLTQREIRLYRRFHSLDGVPKLLGPVGECGLLHAFVPGRELGENDRVDDDFFPRLEDLLGRVHAAGVAYVDLNKRQNILLGEDGRPYLIDFQISLYSRALERHGASARGLWAAIVRSFQQEDRYHLLKHKRRLRPDQLTPAETERAERVSNWIAWHRTLFRPLTLLRRQLLRRLNKNETIKVAGSDAK